MDPSGYHLRMAYWWSKYIDPPRRVTIRVTPGLTEQHMTELFHEFNATGHRVTGLGDRWLVVGTDDKAPERWLKERKYKVEHMQYIEKRPSAKNVRLVSQ